MSVNFSYPLNKFHSETTTKEDSTHKITNLSISTCKKDLQQLLEQLKQLRKNVDNLKTLKNSIEDSVWTMKLEEMYSLQRDILSLIQKYKNTELTENLKKMLQKRRKKRRQHDLLKQNKQKIIETRRQLEESTNEWLKKEREKVLEEKHAIELAKRSEIILSSVNKKIHDAERYIRHLYLIEKLRKCKKRLQPELNYNEKNFEMKVNQLKNVWEDALAEYKDEKNILQSFLNKRTQSLEYMWREVLFGEDFQNEVINTEAKTLREFIEVRRAWDSYIVPPKYQCGSSIPIGWVMPNETPTKEWGLFRSAD